MPIRFFEEKRSKRCSGAHAASQKSLLTREDFEVAGACRNRTYQSPCDDLSDFEDRASHQTRTLPRWRKASFCIAFPIPG